MTDFFIPFSLVGGGKWRMLSVNFLELDWTRLTTRRSAEEGAVCNIMVCQCFSGDEAHLCVCDASLHSLRKITIMLE